jgi:hypothetical protein
VKAAKTTGRPSYLQSSDMQKRLILVFVFLCCTSWVQAQIRTQFSNSYELFIKELTEQLNTAKRDDYKKLANEFSRSWNSEYIDAQRDLIIRTANEMKRKRLPIYPYFGNYLTLLQQLKATDQSATQFYDWHNIYNRVLTLNQRSIDQFVRSSTDFYSQSAIYYSNAIQWQVYAPAYKFEFEDNQVLVRFPALDLRCQYYNDSIVIRQTSGIWYPVDQVFVGDQGVVDWQRAGFKTDSIYANLNQYRVNLKQFQFEADSVDFYNQGLGKFIQGRLQDKCTANLNPDNLSYPRFSSYEGELRLENVFKNVSIRGKYALNGNRYLAVGTRQQPAEVFIYKNDTTTVKALSQQFAIRKTEIYSANAEVNVVLNKDSIYHPGIAMRFTTVDRKLLLFLEPGSINKIPFSNSYHQLDTYCEALSWKIDDPIMEFKMQTGLSEAIAVFTSKDFFDQREYLAAQGYATYNPLVRLYQYGRQTGENYFPSAGFAAFMKLPLNSVRQLLIDLANQGFIYYDREEEEITLLKKLYHYNTASAGRIDYDIIKFVSKTSQESNAVLNIATRELMINGVNVVILSDTHTVFAVPTGRKMLITKNRGMEFSGHVHSGTLDFYGDGFTFNYDSFAVRMQNVDSMRFSVMTGQIDGRGQPILKRIENALENITGVLHIDYPGNKSGRRPIWKYPYFESLQESYVYYDKPDIQNGVYTRDRFFFRVDPFVLDSLDFAGSTKRLKLKGTLVSGIFPELREDLRFQDDFSLGFTTFTPTTGYPMYGGKGTYTNNITLDRQGLHGYGSLQYLSSTSKSNNFYFRPENTSAQLETYDIKKGSYGNTSYPTVKAVETGMLWKPFADSMMVYRGVSPFEVYDGIALFEGDLTYTPQQLYADGTILYGRDKAMSRTFAFEQVKASSEQIRLEIASNTPNVLALKTDDLEGEIDFVKRYGTFENRLGFTRVALPYNEYSARLADLEWDLRNNKLLLGSKADLKDPKTTFRSEHPGQDGFNFMAAYGAMDLNIFDLDLRGIPEMRTADAIVIPDSGKAMVTKEAKMFPLQQAKLIFDSVKQEHQVYGATIDILGRKRYEGEGKYDYIDINKKKQSIYLNIIRPNIKGISTASGTISPDSSFMLNPGFAFYGGVVVSSEKKALNFNGSVRLTALDDTIRHQPFRFNSEFDPKDTYIQVPEFKDEQNRRIFTAVMLNIGSSQVYTSIGGSKIASSDSVLIEAAGIVHYEESTMTYSIGPEKLILNEEGTGNLIRISKQRQIVTARGNIRLGFNKEPIRFVSGGEIQQKYMLGQTDLYLSLMLDILLPDESLKIFYNQLIDYSFGAEDVNNDQEYVRIAFANMLEGRDRERVLTSIDAYGTIPNTSTTDYVMIFSNLALGWDSDTRSFRSTETIGLSNLNGEIIGKRLNGIFEIQILPTGRTMNILFEPSNELYFFFNYRTGRVYPVSSMMEFNETVKKGLGKKKKKGLGNKVSMGITQNKDRLVSRYANWLGE